MDFNIRHPDGSATLAAGQQIGTASITGRTFGPHLHLEHHPSGRGRTTSPYTTDDPYKWMASLGVRL